MNEDAKPESLTLVIQIFDLPHFHAKCSLGISGKDEFLNTSSMCFLC